MFYPLQIPYLLDAEYKNHVEYIEHQPESLKAYIMCIWEVNFQHPEGDQIKNIVLPDACIDLIFDFDMQHIFFVATKKSALNIPLEEDFQTMGVRFRPGTFAELYDFPSTSLIGERITYQEIESTIDLTAIFTKKTQTERLQFITKYLEQKIAQNKQFNFTWINLIDKLYNDNAELILQQLKSECSYSDKTLYRLFKKQYGLSPKEVTMILRMHKALYTMLAEQKTFTDFDPQINYYDQSHFNNEIKKICGITPREIIEFYQHNE